MARPRSVQRVRAGLMAISGVLSGGAVFGGVEGFWIDQKLVAELVDDTEVQLRLTRKLIRELGPRLSEDSRVSLRRSSDWVRVRFATPADASFVGELMGLAAPLYHPPPPATLRPPPTGADLERRRRWH